MRGRPDQQCARRGEPQERRQVARAEHPRGQGARAAQNALKHGMRAAKHVLLPDEDGAEFAALEAALVAERAPVGALQAMLARRIAVAAWRLARADRLAAGTGLGPPFPNPAADRPTCSRNAGSRTADPALP